MLMGCGGFAAASSNSLFSLIEFVLACCKTPSSVIKDPSIEITVEEGPNILDVLEVIANNGYLNTSPALDECIEEYKKAKQECDQLLGYSGSGPSIIKNYIKTRDDLEKIKAIILSADYPDKDKITGDMRQKIINNEHILNPYLSEENLPKCIKSYEDALDKFKLADDKLKEHYSYASNPTFIPSKIAIYERFLKAKKAFEERAATIQLVPASAETKAILAPNLNLPSQT